MYTGVIYKITNLINNKMYIGKTTSDPDKYWERHKTLAVGGYVNKYLYNSMRKHGIDSFIFEIIDEYQDQDIHTLNDQLNSKEMYYIKHLGTKAPHGYNLTDGGEGTVGFSPTPETRQKLSEARMGQPSARKGAKLSKETRRKLSEARMGRFKGEDNPFYGRKHTQETKELIRKKNTEYQNRPDIKKTNKLNQPHRIPVIMCDINGHPLKEFISLRDAQRWIAGNTDFKGDASTISKAVKSGQQSYGFLWKRASK